MKKLLYLIPLFTLFAMQLQAQSRKQVSSFSQFRHYYNPALTGQAGSGVKTLYRNQWTGFEDAPSTLLATAEVDVRLLGQRKGYRFRSESAEARHAFGLNLLHDSFGASREAQVGLSYGASVRLSEVWSLRWGATLSYTSLGLDGNKLTVQREDDPRYAQVLGGQNRMGHADLNLGLALSTDKLYLGYALQDITEAKVLTTGDDYMRDFVVRKHVAQAGYRTNLSNVFGLVLNGIYTYDAVAEGTAEGQLKLAYQQNFWVGGGYRHVQAYNLTAGVRLNKLLISYAYESPVQDAKYIDKPSNEISLGYSLFSGTEKGPQRLLPMW